jgi:leader peptidase (prepilin peptidase)/N-methyltransferase
MIRLYATLIAALLGLAFGSFLNVCLTRWPAGESVLKPRSHCRNCERTLAWWENIPLVSWIALRGRCRTCGAWIGWRYPLVELAVASVWAVETWQWAGPSFEKLIIFTFPSAAIGLLALRLAFCWILVALATLDAENLWLPDRFTLSGIALGGGYVVLAMCSAHRTFITNRGVLYDAGVWLAGVLLAAFLILLIRWTYKLIRHREGIGLGDAKLMAMLAAWLGLPAALLSFVVGVVLGALTALVLLALPSARAKEMGTGEDNEAAPSWWLRKLPLGTFLCIGGIVSALWGRPILSAYLRWAGF